LLLSLISTPQIRVDCTGYVGYSPNPSFDPLIAKIIAHASDWKGAVKLLRQALAQVRIAGVSSNVEFLQALIATREFEENDVTTNFIANNMLRLCDVSKANLTNSAALNSINAPEHQHHHHQILSHQQHLPAGSLPLISLISGRVSRLAVQERGQVGAGACVCVILLA
jgi:acetyl/propionyl-CoA carboxylase alpha subunit